MSYQSTNIMVDQLTKEKKYCFVVFIGNACFPMQVSMSTCYSVYVFLKKKLKNVTGNVKTSTM